MTSEGKATTKGAVAQLAEQPFGTFMIVLVAVGMFLLVLWRLFDLFLGHHEDDGADLWKHRASDLLKAAALRRHLLERDQRAHALRVAAAPARRTSPRRSSGSPGARCGSR